MALRIVDLLIEANEYPEDTYSVFMDLERQLSTMWESGGEGSGTAMTALSKLIGLGVLNDMPENIGQSREDQAELVDEDGYRWLNICTWHRQSGRGGRSTVLRWTLSLDKDLLEKAENELNKRLDDLMNNG